MEPLDPDFTFPAGGTVKCGLRTWLPKKERRHEWRDAGEDMRYNITTGAIRLCKVKICIECGKDEDRAVKRHVGHGSG